MKKLSTLLIVLFCTLMTSQAIKINSKTEIKPYYFKIEKIEYVGDKSFIYGKVKQQERFSYSISFEDCLIISSENPNGVQGRLVEWNDNKKFNGPERPISDSHEEKFVLEFPKDAVPVNESFSLRIGTMLNKQKTPLIIENLSIQRKK